MHLSNTTEQNEVKAQPLQMWEAVWRGKDSLRPAEYLNHTVSKGFRRIWGLSTLRGTENLIKYTLAYLGINLEFPYSGSN